MNISKVAPSSNMVSSSNSSSVLGGLEKQKMELSKQIEKVQEGTGDSKNKAETIKGINDQIVELDKQIQQAKIDEQQKEMEKNRQKNAEKAVQEKYDKADDSEKEGVVLSASLNNLLVANHSNNQVKEMGIVKTKLQGEINIAQGQIKHASSGGSTQYQMDVVSKKGNTLSELEGKIGKKMAQVNKDIDQSVKTGIDEAEGERINKQDQVEGKEDDDKNATNGDEQQVKQVGTSIAIGNVITTQENKIDNGTEKKDKSAKSIKSVDILA